VLQRDSSLLVELEEEEAELEEAELEEAETLAVLLPSIFSLGP
jgi:hypothetical protein